MKEYRVKVLRVSQVTHDCYSIITQKPEGFTCKPGHSTMIGMDKEGMEKLRRPYTLVSLQSDEIIEFIVKDYPDLDGLSTRLVKVKVGDTLILSDTFGSINYKGKGVFIAGGVGITPFLAVLRDLHRKDELDNHHLLYSNKEFKDIIYEQELRYYLPQTCTCTLTRQEREGYTKGRISLEMLKQFDINQEFYICGSGKFVADMRKMLRELKIQKVSEMGM